MFMTCVYFFVALFLLVGIHESGHFLAARYFGVHVIRFSFGFGRILFSRTDKNGTVFSLSAIPLGGYVKLLEQSDHKSLKIDQHKSFDVQPMRKKIVILLAGPVFNFILAWLLIFIVCLVGTPTFIPIVAAVQTNSLAANAGLSAQDVIKTVNSQEVIGWSDINELLLSGINKHKITIQVQSAHKKALKTMVLQPHHTKETVTQDTVLNYLGITPYIPPIPPVIGNIFPNLPAFYSNLVIGDRVVAVNGVAINEWVQLVSWIKAHPHVRACLQLMHAGKKTKTCLTIGSQIGAGGLREGVIGVTPQTPNWSADNFYTKNYGFIKSVSASLLQTAHQINAVGVMMRNLLVGGNEIHYISGPIGIANAAGVAGRDGIITYITFLAAISISLGVINLLPIPVLDGGGIVLCMVEGVLRKPISLKIRNIIQIIGIIFVFILMLISSINDVQLWMK